MSTVLSDKGRTTAGRVQHKGIDASGCLIGIDFMVSWGCGGSVASPVLLDKSVFWGSGWYGINWFARIVWAGRTVQGQYRGKTEGLEV